jgi:hypothetical protein
MVHGVAPELACTRGGWLVFRVKGAEALVMDDLALTPERIEGCWIGEGGVEVTPFTIICFALDLQRSRHA